MKPQRWGRLAIRLWMVGLLQISLVIVAAIVVGPVTGRLLWRADMAALSERLAPVVGDPVALDGELKRCLAEDQAEVSMYLLNGRLLASNVQPPLPPPRPPPQLAAEGSPMLIPGVPPGAGPGHGPFPGMPGNPHGEIEFPLRPPLLLAHIETTSGDVLVVARFPKRTPSLWPPTLTLVFGLVVIAVGFMLIRRLVTRPLRQLSDAVNAFGGGDLSVRAKLKGHDEFGALGRAFDDMAERISDLRTAEKELLANVAHELRTPLARVRVALEIAQESRAAQGPDGTALQATLGEIDTDLDELEALVDDVLATARLEMTAPDQIAAGFALNPDSIEVAGLMRSAANRFRQHHPKRRLEVRLQDELPAFEGDPALCRRVLSNLLENANKYTPDPAANIILSAGFSDGCVFFEVEDCGIGIESDELQRVFLPFYRAERSRTRAAGGVGLGLTLARRIVEAHGGTIALTSEVGVGTRVRVSLPAMAETAPPRRAS